MAPPIDRDKDFLLTVISLCEELAKQADMLLEESDDPVALNLSIHIKGTALVIWKLAREYQPRMEHLKMLAEKNGLQIFEEIARRAQELKDLAERGPNGPRPRKAKPAGIGKEAAGLQDKGGC